MTITPQYTITEQTLTHVTLQVQVPHVRFNVEEIQISFSNDETTVHFYCPPIYLLVLNFAPYRFRNVEDEECEEGDNEEEWDEHQNHEIPSDSDPTTTSTSITATTSVTPTGTPQRHHRAKYLPHVQNGIIQLILEKHLDHQEHWPDLDLLGKLQQQHSSQQQRTNRMSHDIWTAAATSSTTTTTTTTTSAAAAKLNWLQEIVSDDVNENDQTESLPSHDQLQSSTSPPPLHNCYTGTYGFHRMFAHIYDDLQRENSIMTQMLECPWPTTTTTATAMPVVPPTIDTVDHQRVAAIHRQRQEQRHEQYENSKFNVERYMQDLDIDECDDYIYDHAMSLIPHWNQPPQHSDEETSNDYFTSTERQLLTSIPYPLLDDVILAPPPPPPPPLTPTTVETESMSHPPPLSSQLALGMGLIDILYAYVYDHLTTIDQEATVESSWTISTLSISLSWLHDWLPDVDKMTTTTTNQSDVALEGHHSTHIDDMVRSVMLSSIRRSLIYPYIRNFSFSIYVWENVISILDNPNHDSSTRIRTIIRCFLQVRNILNYSDIYYLGNKLFVDPYLIWIQKFSDLSYLQNQVLSPIAQSLRQQLRNETLKDSLDLNLLQIEADFYNDIIDDGNSNDGGSQGAGESDSDTSSSNDEDDKRNCGLPDSSHVGEIQIRTFADDDHVSNESYDVDAAASALQRLELLPSEPNASNNLS